MSFVTSSVSVPSSATMSPPIAAASISSATPSRCSGLCRRPEKFLPTMHGYWLAQKLTDPRICHQSQLKDLSEELPRAGILGVGEKFLRRSVLDDDAAIGEVDVVGDIAGEAHLVRHQDASGHFRMGRKSACRRGSREMGLVRENVRRPE